MIVRTKIIGHYSLFVTHYSEYKHSRSVVNILLTYSIFGDVIQLTGEAKQQRQLTCK